MEQTAALRCGEVDEVNLRIGTRDIRTRSRKCRGVTRADCQWAASKQQVLQPNLRLAPDALHVVVERDRPSATPKGAAIEMVLQILAHAGQVVHDRNSVAFEQRRRTHA